MSSSHRAAAAASKDKSAASAASNSLDVRGARALFENGLRRQREPSPAPVSMSNQNKSSFSSFKEKFEQFTAPRKDTPIPLRKAYSVENVSANKDKGHSARPRTSSSGQMAEKHWLQAKTKIYEKLSEQKAEKISSSKGSVTSSDSKTSQSKTTEETKKKNVDDKLEITPISDKINRFKTSSSSDSTKQQAKDVSLQMADGKKSIKDIKSSFDSTPAAEQKPSKTSASLMGKASMFESKPAVDNTSPVKTTPSSSIAHRYKPAVDDTNEKTEHKSTTSKPSTAKYDTLQPASDKLKDSKSRSPSPKGIMSKSMPSNVLKTAELKSSEERVNDKRNKKDEVDNKHNKTSFSQVEKKSGLNGTHKGHIKLTKIHEVKDSKSAKTFMEDLINAIDNDQHVPMKQLIDLFEKMKHDNSEMKESLEKLKTQLDKSDIDSLNSTLQAKLSDVTKQLAEAKANAEEISGYKAALQEYEERCDELEELNHQHLQEIEYMKLEMNEMRDQFHDDEVHETIILQQRLDDMARSLRIIHFRLKKADARLQETEREKEALLEEIRLLQGGTFTDEEIKRMQALEGDLQSAKEVSVQLHNQLEKSEERQEKLEMEAARLRDELKAANMENDRLRNNILHLREQMSNDALTASVDPNSLSPNTPSLLRQGSSTDLDTLKSNLEAAIERENDLKEQLKFAEEEAKMLRRRLRDIEHENEALTKQLRKLSQIAHSKVHAGGTTSTMSSEIIQAEVIQLENQELRNNNEKLHVDIDNLQAQVKSLHQKLELMQQDQCDGPLSVNKNSLYYETKFELMSREIEHLRWQLQEQEKEHRKQLGENDSQARRKQLRRAITIESDTVDTKKQLDIVQREADILREKLEQLEIDNERLVKENRRHSLDTSGLRPSLEETNHKLTSKVTSLEKERNELIAQLHRQNISDDQQKVFNELESENNRLITELSYYRKSQPETASVVERLKNSEEQIMTYEKELSRLRGDMFRMERDLQDDINSLTMKNSILRSLLEAINQHEGGDDTSSRSSNMTNSGQHNTASTKSSAGRMNESLSSSEEGHRLAELDTDSFITKHINRLPQDIQKQFKEKIESLEAQLREERERARSAEGLLQQVKLHLRSCVLSSPLVKMMQPKRTFRYPSPPPSMVLRPSASNSPSHVAAAKASRLSSTTSTPEKLKIGQSLATHMYLGSFEVKQKSITSKADSIDEDMIMVSIQQNSSPKHTTNQTSSPLRRTESLQYDEPSRVQQSSPLIKSQSLDVGSQTSCRDCGTATQTTTPTTNGMQRPPSIEITVSDTSSQSHEAEEAKESSHIKTSHSTPMLNGYHNGTTPKRLIMNKQKVGSKSEDTLSSTEKINKIKKSALRNSFFENYSNFITKGFKVKKKVSFDLPSLERDVSDMSISSHLSAAGDCIILDEDDELERSDLTNGQYAANQR